MQCLLAWFLGFFFFDKGSGGGALFLRRRCGPWNPGLYRHRLAGLGSQDFRFHHLGDAGGLLGPGKGKPHRIERYFRPWGVFIGLFVGRGFLDHFVQPLG